MERLSMSWVQIALDQNHMNTTFELKISCEESRALAAESVPYKPLPPDRLYLPDHEWQQRLTVAQMVHEPAKCSSL